MAIGVLIRASLLCVLATLVWAGNDNPPSPSTSSDHSTPAVGRDVSCEDTDGKRPACTGVCPAGCPQQCLVLCPSCRTFCRPDQARPAKKPVRRAPAMFIFGDGHLDIGNSNQLASGDYDVPHDEQQTLDPQWARTDGDNMAQFIAKFMGFQGSPPAYLTLPRPVHVDQGFTGVNYACAGAGLRDLDANMDGWLTIPMSKQLRQFTATKAQMEAKLGARAARDLLARSFFLIEVGGVDLTHFLPYPYGKTEVRDLLAMYGDTIRRLYDMGARRFGLINVGLIGNAPGVGGGYDVADMNRHAAEFNGGLKPLLGGLAGSLPGLRYSIADMYAFTGTVFANPSAYGFEDIHDPCSQYGSSVPPMDDPPQCDNPAKHWYWDGNGYITEHAANLAATAFFYGPPQFTVPVTFRALLDGK